MTVIWRGVIPTSPIDLVAAGYLPNVPGAAFLINDSEGLGGIVKPSTPYLVVDNKPVTLSPQSGVKVLAGDESPVFWPAVEGQVLAFWVVASGPGGHASVIEVVGER